MQVFLGNYYENAIGARADLTDGDGYDRTGFF